MVGASQTVWAIVGSHGFGDCRIEWIVCAYADAETAFAHCNSLRQLVTAWEARPHDERMDECEHSGYVDFNGRTVVHTPLDEVCGLIVATENQSYRVERVSLLIAVPA